MKRLLPYLLSAALILTVSGCGSSRDTVEREIQDIQQDQAGAEESVSKPEASDPDSPAQETSESDSSMQEQETSGEDSGTPSGQDSQTESGVPVVYMTTDISAEGLMAVYEALGASPSGNIAVKLSTGEPGSNYLRTDLIGELVQSLDGAIVECNTAYGGSRANTAMHYQGGEGTWVYGDCGRGYHGRGRFHDIAGGGRG